MTNNQLAENSVIQLLNSVKLARDNAERADNRVDHSFYYALTIALEELQERRKAAMDSEPNCKERKLFCSTDTARMRKVISASAGAEATPLYRHAQQPAPVVMDDTKLRELFDSWFASDCSFDLSPEASEADNIAWRESYWYVWKRCRATILAAARQSPGSEPATVPDKWIPVSEQMPEDAQWCVVSTEYGYYVQCWSDGYGWLGDDISIPNIDVTHWMPLPAGPQEPKP
ncbi:TPA: DUF551 domain-containing protein [Klebsiella pneumoniae]|nr:DUF551 domain-containing protein [Klebsiella pneumoniae]